MISTAGGIYVVPALLLASQSRSAVAASPRIPNVIPQAVPDETEMVADLDSRLGAHAAGYSPYSCNPDVKSRIEDEIRRFATDLNLSDPQKAQLRTAFENAETKLDEGTPFQKVRDSIREQVTTILTPQQLTKWDDAMSKAKIFLGHAIKA